MRINYIDTTPEGIARREAIEDLLPKTTLVEQILQPALEQKMYPYLLRMLKAELEVYRLYPKKPAFDQAFVYEKEVKTFDPRHNNTCFMGKAFKSNNHLTDNELYNYRKKIGTINHPVWGDVTLLEIWGGDHFVSHPEMVKGAFSYGFGHRDTLPTLKFYTNPLFVNKKTGKRTLTEEEQEYEKHMEELLAKAMVFGVKDAPRTKRRR